MLTALTGSLMGQPHARPEPRGRARRIANANPKVRRYIAALELQARQAVANVGGGEIVWTEFSGRALLVRLRWEFPTTREERWNQPHLHKPDVDNLTKLILDCLKRSGALGGDDSKVSRLDSVKVWGPPPGRVDWQVERLVDIWSAEPPKVPGWLGC